MRFRISIDVDYDKATLNVPPEDIRHMLKQELDRHIQDGLLLSDFVIDQYSAEVTYCEPVERLERIPNTMW